MRFVSLSGDTTSDRLHSAIDNAERVNAGVKFPDGQGRPVMHRKPLGGLTYISCEMVGGSGGKDNGFLIGTFFLGRISEKNGRTRLGGVILTAPIYHLALIAFCIYFLVQSFVVGGITLMPLILVVFTYFLYRSEYKKQGVISRFLRRAMRYAEENRATDGSGEKQCPCERNDTDACATKDDNTDACAAEDDDTDACTPEADGASTGALGYALDGEPHEGYSLDAEVNDGAFGTDAEL